MNLIYNMITLIKKLKVQMNTWGLDMMTGTGIVLLMQIIAKMEKTYEVTVILEGRETHNVIPKIDPPEFLMGDTFMLWTSQFSY